MQWTSTGGQERPGTTVPRARRQGLWQGRPWSGRGSWCAPIAARPESISRPSPTSSGTGSPGCRRTGRGFERKSVGARFLRSGSSSRSRQAGAALALDLAWLSPLVRIFRMSHLSYLRCEQWVLLSGKAFVRRLRERENCGRPVFTLWPACCRHQIAAFSSWRLPVSPCSDVFRRTRSPVGRMWQGRGPLRSLTRRRPRRDGRMLQARRSFPSLTRRRPRRDGRCHPQGPYRQLPRRRKQMHLVRRRTHLYLHLRRRHRPQQLFRSHPPAHRSTGASFATTRTRRRRP